MFDISKQGGAKMLNIIVGIVAVITVIVAIVEQKKANKR